MLTVGASHRTASSALLGDFSRAAEAFRASVRDGVHVRSRVPVRELAVLSTCARVEVYAVTDETAREEAARLVGREVFGAEVGAPSADVGPYRYQGPEAVRHLCRVASGLESFVVGEHEIAGQVARAFRDAVRVRGDDGVLRQMAAVARHASRRVRSETGIGRYPASVSSVAVELVRERLGELTGARAVVVGAGKAGLLVAKALRSAGVGSLRVVNRSLERATEVAAEVGGDVAELSALPQLLTRADITVTATGAEGVILDVASARTAARERGPEAAPLLILDLALPGDVAPEVGSLEGVELLTLDDVKARVHSHLSLRRDEVGAAERVVDEVVEDFVRKQERPDVDSLIAEVRRSIEEVRSAEVARWLASRRGDDPPSQEELDHLTRSIVNKLLHEPMRRLRSAPFKSGKSRQLLRAARELLGPEGPHDPTASGG